MHMSQPALPVTGGGTLPAHAKAASTGPPPLLVLPLPLLLEPPLLPLLEDPDPELPLLTGPELLPLITPELLPLPDEESVPPPSPWPPVGAMVPPHAARPALTANAAHREARIPGSVALVR
jgi:hypothetical protein